MDHCGHRVDKGISLDSIDIEIKAIRCIEALKDYQVYREEEEDKGE